MRTVWEAQAFAARGGPARRRAGSQAAA
jgi:hypothetical protein